MRHIGDGHEQTPAIAIALAIDGVIEIPCIGAIDGYQRQITQIHAVLDRIGRNTVAIARCFIHDLGRPCPRQAVLTNGNVDLHARRHVLAQHLGDTPDRLGMPGGLFDDLGHHHLARSGAIAVLGWNEDILGDALALGNDKADAALLMVTPHHLVVGALDDRHY